jgi:hypothetical protein
MARPSFVIALLAAIMLVIAGAPTRAAASPCEPCPPDCPMMQQMATGAAGAHDKAPGDKAADDPCKQGVACQLSATMTAPVQSVASATLASATVDHRLGDPLAVPSHPRDRSLRPPIQL